MTGTVKAKKPAVKKKVVSVTKKHAPASKDVHQKVDRLAQIDQVFACMTQEGLSASKSCEKVGINWGLFWQVVSKDEALTSRYAQAREVLLEKMAEELLQIANTPVMGTKSVSKATGLEITEADMVEHRRLQVDTRKWLLSKLAPKKYGDKQQVEHSGAVDIAAGILASRKRAAGG